ncbi:MAG TPA: tRNA (uridine(54)-C5)-methyltransferase TrmA, partial [Pseudomonas sp.]|nr:tRNA (uridine(54)-C5)-methyltransferase TrmA [Pseudomonas sp.]
LATEISKSSVNAALANLADNQIDNIELVRRFDRVLYISCNPETLAQNIRQLSDTHRIVKCALFDQFPWTDHMESGVLLKRK